MFICSLKASKIKFILSAVICVFAAVAVIALMPDTEHTVSVNGIQQDADKEIKLDGIKDESDVFELIQNLGYSVEQTPYEKVQTKIPSKLDAVLEKYNELQKSQGFNLAKYKNKKVDRYTYKVTALPENQPLPEDDVLLTVIVCKGKVIGGDLYISGADSQVLPFLR